MIVLFDEIGYKTLMVALVEEHGLLEPAGQDPPLGWVGGGSPHRKLENRGSTVDGQGLIGLEARASDGTVLGRVTEVLTGEDDDGVVGITHVVVEKDGEYQELPFSSVDLDPEADFGTFEAGAFDDGPGEHEGEEIRPAGYAPNKPFFGPDDSRHEGQFVTTPEDPSEMPPPEDLDREAGEAGGWEDEGSTTADSGYPRNDVYIDPDTGDEVQDPLMKDNESLEDEVADLLADTGVGVRQAIEGVVELYGSVETAEDLEEIKAELMAHPGVREIDSDFVDVG